MICGVTPTVYVSDLDRAVRFYTATLGLTLTMHVPGHWASVAAPDGTNFGLHPAGMHSPSPGTPGATQLGFGVDRPLDQVVTEFQRRGVQFHGPIVDDKQVRLAFLADPDGNPLYLCETKPWPTR